MAQFRLLPGGPAKINGRVYRPGDIVKNNHDLTKLFVGRFELVSGSPGSLEDDDDPRPVTTGGTPFDVSSTKRKPPAGAFVSEEQPIPANEPPVPRPANAIRGGDGGIDGNAPEADEASGAEEEEVDLHEDEESEDVAEKPAARAHRKAATKKPAKRGK
jgi:hypothetical protein